MKDKYLFIRGDANKNYWIYLSFSYNPLYEITGPSALSETSQVYIGLIASAKQDLVMWSSLIQVKDRVGQGHLNQSREARFDGHE